MTAPTFFTSITVNADRRPNNHSFLHTQLPQPEPSVAADEALLESGSLLTQQCGAAPTDEHFQSVECEILIGSIQPEEIVVGEWGKGCVRDTHEKI